MERARLNFHSYKVIQLSNCCILQCVSKPTINPTFRWEGETTNFIATILIGKGEKGMESGCCHVVMDTGLDSGELPYHIPSAD